MQFASSGFRLLSEFVSSISSGCRFQRSKRDVQFPAFLLMLCLFSGCKPAAPTSTKPVTPSTVTKEDQLTTVELTEAAAQRLGVQTAVVEMRPMPRFRTYGGEVMLPTGATIVVSAPVAGILQLPAGAREIKAGVAVTAQQPLLTLLPLVLTPSERTALAVARTGIATQRADAGAQVEQAQITVSAAKIALDRAKKLFERNVGKAQDVDDQTARVELGEQQLEAALSRKKIVDQIRLDDDSGHEPSPMMIESPQAGIVRSVHVKPGEIVNTGSPLFEVMNGETLWVRVPVYVGEVAGIAPDAPAEIGELSSRPGQNRLKAQPIAAPPTATALAATLDVYYELSNAGATLRPGQRVSVEVPLSGDAEQLMLPWSAVVQDIHGGHWVYEQLAEHKFVRRRLQIKRVIDSWAVIERGPPAGTTVVVAGAAEIFGDEFGFGK